jgi:hypothetical protein
VHSQHDVTALHLVAAQTLSRKLQVELGVTPAAASAEQQSSRPLTIEALAALPPPTE